MQLLNDELARLIETRKVDMDEALAAAVDKDDLAPALPHRHHPRPRTRWPTRRSAWWPWPRRRRAPRPASSRGDQVIELDGTPSKEFTLDEMRQAIRIDGKRQITVDRGGKRVKLVMELAGRLDTPTPTAGAPGRVAHRAAVAGGERGTARAGPRPTPLSRAGRAPGPIARDSLESVRLPRLSSNRRTDDPPRRSRSPPSPASPPTRCSAARALGGGHADAATFTTHPPRLRRARAGDPGRPRAAHDPAARGAGPRRPRSSPTRRPSRWPTCASAPPWARCWPSAPCRPR